MTPELRRPQLLAFRAEGHGLGRRRRAGDLAGAAGVMGLRRTKHAGVALAARVEGVRAGDLERALVGEELIVVYGARGTLTVVPPADIEVFTRGAAPADESSLRAALPGAFLRQLDAAGMKVADALAAVVDAVRTVLADGARGRGDVARAVTRALPGVLSPPCRGRCPDPHVEDSLFRLAGVSGAMRFSGNTDDLVALGEPLLPADEARRELVRRYLRCYGPAAPATLAEWAGISAGDASSSLAGLGEEAVTVGQGVLLRDDLDRARSATCAGVRFLPAFDPWLLDRDRATLVPQRGAQRVLWRATGSPGVALVDGEPAAAWRTATKAGRLTLRLEPLAGGPALDTGAVQEEAQVVGAALGAQGQVEVAR